MKLILIFIALSTAMFSQAQDSIYKQIKLNSKFPFDTLDLWRSLIPKSDVITTMTEEKEALKRNKMIDRAFAPGRNMRLTVPVSVLSFDNTQYDNYVVGIDTRVYISLTVHKQGMNKGVNETPDSLILKLESIKTGNTEISFQILKEYRSVDAKSVFLTCKILSIK